MKVLEAEYGENARSSLNHKNHEDGHGHHSHNKDRKYLVDHGAENSAGNVMGVYMHGFFDSDSFRRWFLNSLRIKKGLSSLDTINVYENTVERKLDRLADIVESSVDISGIYKLMGLNGCENIL